ncbi:MAG: ATP-grasp domain-containing protein [Sphingobacteriales bacterium]|nr:ATP-grasp domain-containing protein [Sphingobacteriales bacterium]
MNESYKNIQWVVQRNLTSQSDFEQLKSSCDKTGVKFIAVDIIPFTAELPLFDRSRESIIYGSTTFNSLASKDVNLRKGLFFDEATFSLENYFKKWGHHMLNYDATVTTFNELMDGNPYSPDKLLFIRPNDDSKSFAGEVKRFDEIENWYNRLKVAENTNLSLESKIVVSEPYKIDYEWRLWIINKKVVAASKYRQHFKLRKEEGCPADVALFAEERCQEYTPHDVFVMDVCLCGDGYFIVECGCMNGAGFYNANIDIIVANVTNYFMSSI